MEEQSDRFDTAWPIAAAWYGIIFSIIEAFGAYSNTGRFALALLALIGVVLLLSIGVSIIWNLHRYWFRRATAAVLSPLIALLLMPALWSGTNIAGHVMLLLEWPHFERELRKQDDRIGHRYLAENLGSTGMVTSE